MKKLVLWIDDIRNPKTYYTDNDYDIIWCKSVNEAIKEYLLIHDLNIATVIDLDHDAGDYFLDGGDYIKFLDWMEEHYANEIPYIEWRIHSMNPVGMKNMFTILRRNGGII